MGSPERGADQALEHLRLVLRDDLVTEYDARLYSAYLASTGIEFGADFRAVERAWLADEERHHLGFAAAYERMFDRGRDEIDRLHERVADFSRIEHLFVDEFHVCLLNCFDELVTLRGYRANRAVYAPLGDEFARFVDAVVADEARHFADYLWLIRRHHGDRIDEAPAALDRIAAANWHEYAATFVLDHDDPVYDEQIMAEARDVLLRRLSRPSPAGFVPGFERSPRGIGPRRRQVLASRGSTWAERR